MDTKPRSEQNWNELRGWLTPLYPLRSTCELHRRGSVIANVIWQSKMFGQKPKNPDNLSVIKTARTLEEINAAADKGFRPLIKPVEPSSEIHNMVAVYQHRETGQIELIGDCPCGPEDVKFEYVLPFRHYYQ